MTPISELKNWSVNDYADFWRYEAGLNVIPADTRNKRPKVEWKQFQHKAIPVELHNFWKKEDMFKDGMMIIAGQVWHNERKKGLFLNCIDLDNELAIQEFCKINGQQMALNVVADTGHFTVEQHVDDPTRAHIFVWSDKRPFKKKISNAADNVPRIEVKGEGNDSLVSVTPSPHTNGSNYEFVGDWHLAVMEPKIHNQIEEHINTICERYGIEYLNGDARRHSHRSGNYQNQYQNQKIPVGERHNTLLSYANKLIARLLKTETPKETIRKYFETYNNEECEEPLPESELKQIFNDAWDNIVKSTINNNSNQKQKQDNNSSQEQEDKELLEQKVTKEDIDFAINTMAKEAEHDRISIKQLFHGYNSGFTKTVIHGNLNSKNAGAGKSYLLNKVADYYPDKYVYPLTGVSDKAFQHKEGIMVLEDKDNGELTEVEPIINKLHLDIVDLEQKIEEAKDKKDKSLIKELKQQIAQKEEEVKTIQEKQMKLIILSNTIILFLDTPQDAVTDNLMSVLSNDTTRDQKYLFTDKSASGKLGSKYNILRGTPVVFTTRVIDDSRSGRFEEKNRRFVNITPNVSPEKIQDANTLMWEECGLTPEEYDQTVVSREDKEKVKKIVSILVAKLKDHSKYLKPKQFGLKIPFIYSIKIPNNDVWAMTAIDRMRRYLSIITKENMDSRPRLVRKDNPKIFLPIATFEDLKETLELMEVAGSNVRPYLAQWYNSVFLPLFNAEGGIVRTRIENIGEKSEKTLVEDYVAVTSKQLCQISNIGNEELRHKYIDPLVNQGIINKTKSNIRKNENIYWPADSKGQNIFTLFDGGDFKLHVEDPKRYPTKNLIINSFRKTGMFGEMFGDKQGGIFEKNILDTYRLEDADGTEITPEQLADRYFSDPETCFIIKNTTPFVAEDPAEHFQNQGEDKEEESK